MADGVSIDIKGIEEVQKKLRSFQGNSARRILTRTSRASMKETRKKAKENAKRLDDPKTAEVIQKNIMTKLNAKKFNSSGVITARVGVQGGSKKGSSGGKGGDTYYWRFLEFGTSRQSATPFLRPAMDQEQITSAFVSELDKSIAKEIAKYGNPS